MIVDLPWALSLAVLFCNLVVAATVSSYYSRLTRHLHSTRCKFTPTAVATVRAPSPKPSAAATRGWRRAASRRQARREPTTGDHQDDPPHALSMTPASYLPDSISTPAALPAALNNTYFIVRHGQSTANVAQIISSNPAVGTATHGLTVAGRAQAEAAGADLCALLPVGTALSDVVFYTSDFVRARETCEVVAEVVVNTLRIGDDDTSSTELSDGYATTKLPIVETALRERWFGSLDGGPVGTYNDVWPKDLCDAGNEDAGVESVAAVTHRLSDMLIRLESKHSSKCIVLASHADVLQILQVWLSGYDCRRFSHFRLGNGEVRRCFLRDGGASLPEAEPPKVTAVDPTPKAVAPADAHAMPGVAGSTGAEEAEEAGGSTLASSTVGDENCTQKGEGNDDSEVNMDAAVPALSVSNDADGWRVQRARLEEEHRKAVVSRPPRFLGYVDA